MRKNGTDQGPTIAMSLPTGQLQFANLQCGGISGWGGGGREGGGAGGTGGDMGGGRTAHSVQPQQKGV